MPLGLSQTKELSLPLLRSPDTRIHMRLTVQAKAIQLFLTTASHDEAASSKPMGSMVCAILDRSNDNQPLATTLFSSEVTVEFSTRLAKILARKSRRPVYLTNSISLESAGMGGTIEEEMEALQDILAVTLETLSELGAGSAAVNGTSECQP